ncbi:MAG: lyase family protein [Spirochaetia bacterium]
MTGFSRVYIDHVLNPGYRNWKRLYYADLLAVHKAHLVMLVETGIVTHAAATGIKASMARIEAGTPFPDHIPDAMEDLYFAFERELDRQGGENAASLHTARSRNDMDTTVFRLALKRELCELVGHFASVAGTILARARAGQSELTVLYTHGQPANVSTMAHYLTAFLLDLLEGIESLVGAMGLTDRCPLGACAITGTGFAIDRDRTSHLLGFRSPVPNSYQAIATSHWLTGPAQALEHVLSDTGRLAADMLHKAAPEVGLLVFPDELVQTSSIMPQKRNPVILEHIRIQSGLAAGSCDSIVKLFRNVPYQDVNEVADAPVSEFLDSLARVHSCASLLAAAIGGVASDQARARSLALTFGVTTTELADTMVRSCGVSFRSAHRACAAFVRSGYDKARLREAFREIAGRELPLSIEEIDEALAPERFVAVRKTPGGPAPGGMESVYAAVQAAMSRIAAAIAEMDERGRSAAAELEAAWTKL